MSDIGFYGLGAMVVFLGLTALAALFMLIFLVLALKKRWKDKVIFAKNLYMRYFASVCIPFFIGVVGIFLAEYSDNLEILKMLDMACFYVSTLSILLSIITAMIWRNNVLRDHS